MKEDIVLSIAAIAFLGVAAQWVAVKVKAPAILFLLVAGVLAGPITDIVEPDELLGPLLFPAISAAVGVLLFEGGLSLRFAELKEGRQVVLRLVTVGVLVTWMVGAISAAALLQIEAKPALLIGAVLVVSGPTVVLPLLRHARPREPSANILRWEGIVIDPIGAILAIVVFDAVISEKGFADGLNRIVSTLGAGTVAGAIGALILIEVLRRHMVPDHLHNPLTLGLVLASFAAADLWRPEAGLMATTVMGMVLANQHVVAVGHIREFEENLGTLILGSLFILLGARIELDELSRVLLPSLGLLVMLVVVGRPLAVWVSTIGTDVSEKHRAYLACMAPRGVVAAAVSAIFGLELVEHDLSFPELVPVTYLVIIGTVLVYGALAKPAAGWLQVSRAPKRGIALIGGQQWVLHLAEQLARLDVPVLVVSTDEREVADAAEKGILTYFGRLDSDDLDLALETVGIRQVIAVSPAHELNAYGMLRLVETLGRANVFHLPPGEADGGREAANSQRVFGRRPFGAGATQAAIADRIASGDRFHSVALDDGQQPADGAIVMFRIDRSGKPSVSYDGAPPPTEGRAIVLSPAGRVERT